MSRFFDSEMVRKSVMELDELQDEIYSQLMNLVFFDKNQKREHLNLMKKFLEKQKNFIFRLSLSDDPEAVELKDKILESAQVFGLPPNGTFEDFFNILESQVDYIEKSLDD